MDEADAWSVFKVGWHLEIAYLLQWHPLMGMQVQGQKKVVGSMGPGEFFGELALIRQNSTRAADCIAVRTTKVRFMALPHPCHTAWQKLLSWDKNVQQSIPMLAQAAWRAHKQVEGSQQCSAGYPAS